MHRHYVEVLIAEEEAALRQAVEDGTLLRVERRGLLLIAEIPRTIYPGQQVGRFGPLVPILAQRRESSVVAVLDCDNYDTDPPAFSLATDWDAQEALPFSAWPKGMGVVHQHPVTQRPFLCRPGLHEYHTHFQHGDDPWDKHRGRVRPREILLEVADNLRRKQVVA